MYKILKVACSLALILLVVGSILLVKPSESSANRCQIGIKSIDVTEFSNEVTTDEVVTDSIIDRSVTIQCGAGTPLGAWSNILNSARLTNANSKTRNFTKTGGSTAAMRDFNSMPGTVTMTTDDGVVLKVTSNGTLTYYPKATSTSTPSLQYPSLSTQKWDKG